MSTAAQELQHRQELESVSREAEIWSEEPDSSGWSACEIGSYGRGVYAGHSTHDLDFSRQGSYGRGVYAGHSTHDLDFDRPGSYGRGIYAGTSTHDLDFSHQGSFAEGMQKPMKR